MRGRSILHNTLLLTLANLALRSVSLLFQVYLSDTIGAAGIGKMQLVLTAGAFAMTLGTSGVRVAAMNLTAQEWGKGDLPGIKKALHSCLMYGTVFSFLAGSLLWGLAPRIAVSFVKDPSVIPAIGVLALSLPMNCAVSIYSGFYTARGKIRSLVTIEVIERIASIGITVVLLLFWAGSDMGKICCAVIGGSSISTLFSLLAMWFQTQKELQKIPSAPGIPMAKRLLSLCIPLALSDYLRSGLSTLEQFLIPRGLSRSAGSYDTSMADYGTISGMVFPVLMFPAAVFYSLSDLLVPELSRCRVQGKNARIRHIVNKSLHIGAVFSALIAGLLYLLAPALGTLLYSSESAGLYLREFAPLIVILYLDALTDGMLKGLGEQVASVRYNTITAAMDVALLYLLLPIWGLRGFFFSFTVTHLINFYLSFMRLVKITDYTPHVSPALKACIFSVVCVFCTLKASPPANHWLSVAISGGLFSAAYLWLVSRTGVLSKGDLRQFLPQKWAK